MRSVVTVSLPPKLAKELERAAKRLGVPKSQLVRKALERVLLAGRFEQLCRDLERDAQRAGILTDQDVFDRVS